MAPLYWFAKDVVKKMHSCPLIYSPTNGYNEGKVMMYAHKIIHISCDAHASTLFLPE